MNLGFTRQERSVVLFLIVSLITGVGVRVYQKHFSVPPEVDVNQKFIDDFKKRANEINSIDSDSLSLLSAKSQLHQDTANISSSNKKVVKISKNQPPALIDINSANKEELQLIPKIGPKLANRIIEYRQTNGKFRKLEDLQNVKGIGPATWAKMKPFMTLANK